MKATAIYCIALLLSTLSVVAAPLTNLVTDCSFESPLPLWFAENGYGTYYAAKEYRDDAADEKTVMVIKGWQMTGSTVLSPVIALNASTVSVVAQMRGATANTNVSCEVALFDEQGKKKIVSLATFVPEGGRTWHTLSTRGVAVPAGLTHVRLAFTVKGPHRNAAFEIDSVGLFAGTQIPPVTSNVSYAFVEAEDMADGTVWMVREHYPGWYFGFPSDMKMLAGPHGIAEDENRPLVETVSVAYSGKHKLWVRFLSNFRSEKRGNFSVSIKQDGETIAKKEFHDGDLATYAAKRWVWDSIDAELQRGEAQIVLERSPDAVSWVSRKIDCFLLTNYLTYEPAIQHFKPAGYMRFVNESEGQDPFCLWIRIRRQQEPVYATPGILTHAGIGYRHAAPRDRGLLLATGDTSAWVRISDYLSDAGGRNNLEVKATRSDSAVGLVEGRITGRLEFAVGRKRSIIKTIPVDQHAPRILLTLPADLQTQSDEIRTPWYYIKEKQAHLKTLQKPAGRVARHLDLSANLALYSDYDDMRVIDAEIEIIKQLGFNNTYKMMFAGAKALDNHKAHGLAPRFGLSAFDLFTRGKQESMYHPQHAAIEGLLTQLAEQTKATADSIVRIEVMDEPSGMTYDAILKSAPCRELFRQSLRQEGWSPRELGADSWDDVRPIGPADKENHPELFYHTGIFRLKALPFFMKTITEIKNKHFSKGAATYCNYLPPHDSGWTARGTDPFYLHRDDALEMPWSEDWLGYGAGVQHMSTIYALLRSAARRQHQPLGGYVIGTDTPNDIIMRMKLYTSLAAGLRQISVFNYGPIYSVGGHDDWSMKFDLYQELADTLHEFGTIDEALHGTVRQATDIAILYNRTSAIWADPHTTSEQNNWYIHWALAHAGYDAEYIPEEDIEDGYLARYKVLYLDGVQVRRKCAERITAWVEQGGVLFGSAGAGSRDQYNRPLAALESVFGARSSDCRQVMNVGRPKYELRKQKSLGTVTTSGDHIPTVTFDQLCYVESLEPAGGAAVIARTADGDCAGVMNTLGNGTAIRLAALPGISYVHEAVRGEAYDPKRYLPTAFRQSLRELIVWPAVLADARRVAETAEPITEIVRYDGIDRAVVFIIDHDAVRKERITVALHNAAQFTKAYTASGSDVRIAPGEANTLTVSLPMYVADAIVLQE